MRSLVVMFAAVVVLLTAVAQSSKSADEPKKGAAPHAHDKMSAAMAKEMRTMNDKMVQHLGAKDPEFENRFIEMMIPHHEGAIAMAKQALQNANRPELKEMAQKMIEAQQKEIEQLKKWQHDWHQDKATKK